jgi:polyhydroxyalkanoate synthesis repressor PhaR
MTTRAKKPNDPTIVKKYANRRLYDTGRSSYVTLEDLCEMLQRGYDFVVVDAKTGEDLTRSVLTQIIVEQESKGETGLLPTNFLRQLIGFYDGKLQNLVPDYLEQAMGALTEHQEKFRAQMNKSMGNMGAIFPGLHALEDMQKKNIAMFENAMRAITPFSGRDNTPPRSERAPTRQEKIAHIRQQIAELQRELDKLQRQ